MARPQKNNCDYFSHDNDMRNDDRIRAVRRKFKHDGYSVWNMLLEVLCKSEHFVLKMDTIKIETLSGDFDIDSVTLIQMIGYFCDINLLKRYGDGQDYYFCENLVKRLYDVLIRRNIVSVDENTYPKELLQILIQLNVVSVDIKPQIKVNKSKVNNSVWTHALQNGFVGACRIFFDDAEYISQTAKKYGVGENSVLEEINKFVTWGTANKKTRSKHTHEEIGASLEIWFSNEKAFQN